MIETGAPVKIEATSDKDGQESLEGMNLDLDLDLQDQSRLARDAERRAAGMAVVTVNWPCPEVRPAMCYISKAIH